MWDRSIHRFWQGSYLHQCSMGGWHIVLFFLWLYPQSDWKQAIHRSTFFLLTFLHWLKGLCGSDPICVCLKTKVPPNPSNSSLLPVIFCHNWWYLPIVSYFQTRLDPKIGDSTSAKYHGQQWWENHVFSEPNPIKSVPVVSNWRLERRVLAALAPCRTWTSCRRSSFRRKPRSENQLDRQL